MGAPRLFHPFPLLNPDGTASEGLLVARPDSCTTCTSRPCLKSPVGERGICDRGFAHFRLGQDLPTIVGVVVKDLSNANAANTKARRKIDKHQQMTAQQFDAVSTTTAAEYRQRANELESARAKQIAELRASVSSEDVSALVRQELEPIQLQFHDYLNLAVEVEENAEMIVRRIADGSLGSNASNEIGEEVHAIRASAALMISKVRFTLLPGSIYDLQDDLIVRNVNFHQLVTKFFKIYEKSMISRRLRHRFTGRMLTKVEVGEFHSELLAHNLVDNAIKYAPSDTEIHAFFNESSTELEFSISSFGPQLDDDEYDLIFDQNYRGRHARNHDGTGSGLTLARAAVVRLGGAISVSQDPTRTTAGAWWTTFRVSIPLP